MGGVLNWSSQPPSVIHCIFMFWKQWPLNFRFISQKTVNSFKLYFYFKCFYSQKLTRFKMLLFCSRNSRNESIPQNNALALQCPCRHGYSCQLPPMSGLHSGTCRASESRETNSGDLVLHWCSYRNQICSEAGLAPSSFVECTPSVSAFRQNTN